MPAVSYPLISLKLANKHNMAVLTVGVGTTITLPAKEAGIYAIEHKPTHAMYVGSSRDLRAIHQSWFYRLAHLDTTPVLNWAFRAIFTTRSDFVFHVLATIPDDAMFNDRAMQMEKMVLARITSKGKEYVLNSNNSYETREFWVSRVPVEERDARFRKIANSKPLPIIPYRPAAGDPNSGASGDTAASSEIAGGSLQAEANAIARSTEPKQVEKVTLIPGKLQGNALGSPIAKKHHCEALRNKYREVYNTQVSLDDGDVWGCWVSTEHITHSLERQLSTIKEMRARVQAKPGADLTS